MDPQLITKAIGSMNHPPVSFENKFPSKEHYEAAKQYSGLVADDFPKPDVSSTPEVTAALQTVATPGGKLGGLEMLAGRVIGFKENVDSFVEGYSREVSPETVEVADQIDQEIGPPQMPLVDESPEVRAEFQRRIEDLKTRIYGIEETLGEIIEGTVARYIKIADDLLEDGYERVGEKINDKESRGRILRNSYEDFEEAREDFSQFSEIGMQLLEGTYEIFEVVKGLMPMQMAGIFDSAFEQILPNIDQARRAEEKELELKEGYLREIFGIESVES